MLFRTSLVCLCIGWTSTLWASPLNVDGNLSDWGLIVADNNGSHLSTFLPGIGLLGYHLEDQNDYAGLSASVGPGYGGQAFDGELLAAAMQGGTLYIAIVSGQRPDNGFSYYEPGDIRVATSSGTYGIEVGGAKGGQSGPTITEGGAGATYTLKSNGEVMSYAQASAAQTAGSIWKGVDWILDPIGQNGPTQFKINGSSTNLGIADYVFTQNTTTTQHSIIELSLDTALFGGQSLQGIYWRPSCGNDELNLNLSGISTPEPATVIFLALGCLPMLRRRGY